MIILDTDVLSALMRPCPEVSVLDWLNRQARISVWTTAVTVFEVRYGIALLAPGARRNQLRQAFDRAAGEMIEDRILPFDASAAEHTADLMAERRRNGHSAELRDTMIAGIAIAHHASLATRNVRHFADLPISVVNPWPSEE